MPSPGDTFRVGSGNLLFGWSDRFFAPAGAPASAERDVGWPPIQLVCFGAATWTSSATPAGYQVLPPPPGVARDPVEVAFVAQNPARPQGKDGAVDSRALGLGLIAVRLDWP